MLGLLFLIPREWDVMVLKRLVGASAVVLAVSFMTGCSLWSSKQTAATVPPNTNTKEITILLPEYATASSRTRNSSFEKGARLFEEANPGVKVTVEKLPMTKGYRAAMTERLNDSKPVDLIFGPFDPVLNEQRARYGHWNHQHLSLPGEQSSNKGEIRNCRAALYGKWSPG